VAGEETVGVEWGGGRVPESVLLADGAELAVVEVLEYWQHPRYGDVAAATLSTTRAIGCWCRIPPVQVRVSMR
jgi:hypothetical protein